MNIEEVLEALSDIETPPGSDDESEDELDGTGESSSTDEGSEGELESTEESESKSESNHECHRASSSRASASEKGKGKVCRTVRRVKGRAGKLTTNRRQ